MLLLKDLAVGYDGPTSVLSYLDTADLVYISIKFSNDNTILTPRDSRRLLEICSSDKPRYTLPVALGQYDFSCGESDLRELLRALHLRDLIDGSGKFAHMQNHFWDTLSGVTTVACLLLLHNLRKINLASWSTGYLTRGYPDSYDLETRVSEAVVDFLNTPDLALIVYLKDGTTLTLDRE